MYELFFIKTINNIVFVPLILSFRLRQFFFIIIIYIARSYGTDIFLRSVHVIHRMQIRHFNHLQNNVRVRGTL